MPSYTGVAPHYTHTHTTLTTVCEVHYFFHSSRWLAFVFVFTTISSARCIDHANHRGPNLWHRRRERIHWSFEIATVSHYYYSRSTKYDKMKWNCKKKKKRQTELNRNVLCGNVQYECKPTDSQTDICSHAYMHEYVRTARGSDVHHSPPQITCSAFVDLHALFSSMAATADAATVPLIDLFVRLCSVFNTMPCNVSCLRCTFWIPVSLVLISARWRRRRTQICAVFILLLLDIISVFMCWAKETLWTHSAYVFRSQYFFSCSKLFDPFTSGATKQ